MLGITQSAALVGVDAHPVQVEVNTGEAGELKFILVGLPDAAGKESQDRVFSAMANSGFRTPATLALRPCLRPYLKSRQDHRRSRWLQTNRDPTPPRSDPIS